ncbi:peptidoglycan D,D-transpeptidase FtsI family protein [Patulibacter defluvii]|uniref:peptidoglycan D,D-transpeptidase FtsI family protein n=1 Tax=Patulibacter defluvii TaxID=3095358 RepID=UPI002A75ED0D|nr:penicillin-binding protein 2 [Patulibacter sp. DM4]
MNAQIRNLFVVVVLLFGVLIAFTSRWTVFEDGDLRANALNKRDVIRAQRVPRGRIVAADGTVLARSVRVRSRDTNTRVYTRKYPQGSAFAAPVGYSFVGPGQTGLERSQNEWLAGKAVKLATAVDKLIKGDQRGDDVHVTLEPRVQRAAISALAGRAGSVVALEPRTGKVLAMVSVPSYDPNKMVDDDYRARLNKLDKTHPQTNRATQDAYVPGSTFKVVTAAAALDSGKYTPDSTVDGSDGQLFSGTPLRNFGGENFPGTTLRNALTHSVNTAFANVAEDVGRATMKRYMERFGFDERPPLDYPAEQMRPSGEFRDGKFIPATSRFVDVARLGIGQDKLQVTPLQMAMVAAAVANGGRLMKPHLLDRVVDADGRVQRTVEPELYRRVMSASAASDLRSMMGDVVREGTGTASALSGIEVGGKTGTAELNIQQGINDLWFIGFAPLSSPKVAVAVVVENTPGQGGVVAAPIAKQVMEAALQQGAGR